MDVRAVAMVGFMRHDNSHIELPANGVVLITGTNGSGKSTCVEAVGTCWYGKTVRGTSPWRKDAPGWVGVRTDNLAVNRKKPKSGAVKLQWGETDESLNDYGTASKAQVDIQPLVGDFDTWRRTSVFLSEEAATFSKATDGERKRLVEKLTGTDRFDKAVKLCRADLKEKRKAYTKADREFAVLEERLKGFKRRLEELEEEVEDEEAEKLELIDPAPLKEKVSKLKNLIASCAREIEGARARRDRIREVVIEAQAVLRNAEKEADRLAGDDCPTCGQPITEETRDRLESEVSRKRAQLETATAGAEARAAEIDEELEELQDERSALDTRKEAARDDLQTAAERVKAVARATKLQRARTEGLAQAQAALEKLQGEVEEAEAVRDKLAAEIAELEATERVLGLQGVRAHILGRALTGIEAVANSWLAKIGWPGLAIRLKPYKEKSSSEGVQDKIHMVVEGAGGGEGYDAASTGEKRRIDIGILFGLAIYAAAARGVRLGTMWLDEIMDGLDSDGIDAVSAAVAELAEERAVVVISHHEELCRALRPVKHYRVLRPEEVSIVEDAGSSVAREA